MSLDRRLDLGELAKFASNEIVPDLISMFALEHAALTPN